MTKVLVAYATKHQSTAEIAATIAEVLLRSAALHVDLLSVEHVAAVEPYHAIILGSAVYMGQWQPEAMRFLETNEETLSRVPTWMFSSGPTGGGDPRLLANGWRYPEDIKPFIERIHPRDVALFHGKLDLSQLTLMERAMLRLGQAPVGDYREWDNINAWAERVAVALRKTVAA